MPYNELMADRVRELIVNATDKPIREKTMFGGLTFLVDEKICVGVKSDQVLVRISPADFEAAQESIGVKPMRSGVSGFLFVDNTMLHTQKQLKHWVDLALAFNPHAKATAKKTTRSPSKTAAAKTKK